MIYSQIGAGDGSNATTPPCVMPSSARVCCCFSFLILCFPPLSLFLSHTRAHLPPGRVCGSSGWRRVVTAGDGIRSPVRKSRVRELQRGNRGQIFIKGKKKKLLSPLQVDPPPPPTQSLKFYIIDFVPPTSRSSAGSLFNTSRRQLSLLTDLCWFSPLVITTRAVGERPVLACALPLVQRVPDFTWQPHQLLHQR